MKAHIYKLQTLSSIFRALESHWRIKKYFIQNESKCIFV